jgi:hypothetical protein
VSPRHPEISTGKAAENNQYPLTEWSEFR